MLLVCCIWVVFSWSYKIQSSESRGFRGFFPPLLYQYTMHLSFSSLFLIFLTSALMNSSLFTHSFVYSFMCTLKICGCVVILMEKILCSWKQTFLYILSWGTHNWLHLLRFVFQIILAFGILDETKARLSLFLNLPLYVLSYTFFSSMTSAAWTFYLHHGNSHRTFIITVHSSLDLTLDQLGILRLFWPPISPFEKIVSHIEKL